MVEYKEWHFFQIFFTRLYASLSAYLADVVYAYVFYAVIIKFLYSKNSVTAEHH